MDPTPNALQAQKRRTGEWVFADPIEGGTFINVGDFLEKWSNMRVHKSAIASVTYFLFFPTVCFNCAQSGVAKVRTLGDSRALIKCIFCYS